MSFSYFSNYWSLSLNSNGLIAKEAYLFIGLVNIFILQAEENEFSFKSSN
jgi:hypothetical protein